ncbi:hypothetical protein F9K33_05245 [bacterium]|nr:MAG: hypothetical protein F9K33_05245 [bacterium]
MNNIAESYVKLVLQVGLYDADFVDAYYGPEEWKPSEPSGDRDDNLKKLEEQTMKLSEKLKPFDNSDLPEMDRLRYNFLAKQCVAIRTKIQMLIGKKFTFDEESRLLYDAVAPKHDKYFFEKAMKELDNELPGSGSVSQRLEEFKNAFIIPKDKLDQVFKAAIEEGRKRTRKYISLPENENFVVEYVTNKAWSGYNWYKGGAFSLIQINTDLPIYIDRAVDLACHEGYPGHHVYNSLLEKHLVRENKWFEFSAYALFSPQSLIAEGTANFGIEMALSGKERIDFESKVLFPIAGMAPETAAKYYQIHELVGKLGYAGNEAARDYLDGKMTMEEAVEWLIQFGLYPRDRAQQRIRFIEKYRSYVINYNLGQDIVKNYIEKNGGTLANPEKRWSIFTKLISTPQTPSGLN